MRKSLGFMAIAICCMLSFCFAGNGESALSQENSAAGFTAYTGIYSVGTDFPDGKYSIQCANETPEFDISIEDADGRTILCGQYSGIKGEKIHQIELLCGYTVKIGSGAAFFSPSTGGIAFEEASSADIKSQSKWDSLVQQAISALTSFWKEAYAKDQISENGYLEIVNTRIISIKSPLQKDQNNTDASKQAAKQYFGDTAYIIEFVLYTDYFGSHPYYSLTELNNCVIVKKDGTYTVSRNPFDLYRSRTYSTDYSGIIEQIDELGGAYDAVYELLR